MSARHTAALLGGLVALAAATACAPPPLMRLPAEPGRPAGDAVAVISEAAQACAGIVWFVAEASVTGSVRDQRVRATLHVGVTAPDAARLEALAPFGRPIFTFVARDRRASLLLTRPDRVVRDADPAALLEAVTGVPLDASGLRAALTGCAQESTMTEFRAVGERWRVGRAGERLRYFQRTSDTGPWRLVATIHQAGTSAEWRAEYHEHAADGLPRMLRLARLGSGGFNLRLGLSQVETDVPLDVSAFDLRIPSGAEPITLEELRAGAVLTDDEDAAAR